MSVEKGELYINCPTVSLHFVCVCVCVYVSGWEMTAALTKMNER